MKNLLILIFQFIPFLFFCQNTIGTITNSNSAYSGYTLFAPNKSNETYLIDNCGQIINLWSSVYFPGNSVYLLENGNLLRAGKIDNSNITFGGVGGHIQLFDWDNNLIWEYTYSSNLASQHHDIYPLPNGNILMLSVTTISQTAALQLGRNPDLILDGKLYNEQILELEPVGNNEANIIWEWNIKDHLIQDYNSSKSNYGVVVDHPELLDFNWLNNNNGNANWLHFNSIQYNSTLDQIVMSSRLLSEIYIIDHSTTTSEAASHSGGTYGKGGDILYRWGNPESYDMGDITSRTLFSQHYPHWIPDGLVDAGKIILFNNGNSRRYSSVNIFSPSTLSPGVYDYDLASGFGPVTSDWTYTDPINRENFFSSILSSAQRLPNGNTLICDGDSGYFFELDPSENIIWEYINPDTANGILNQGDTPSANLVFRAHKYSLDYPAFNGRDVTPGNPIESNPDLTSCTNLSLADFDQLNVSLYPNPTNAKIKINSNHTIDKVEVYNVLGRKVDETNTKTIDFSEHSSGIYFLKIYSNTYIISKKVIKSL
jgi:hypothetical protein